MYNNVQPLGGMPSGSVDSGSVGSYGQLFPSAGFGAPAAPGPAGIAPLGAEEFSASSGLNSFNVPSPCAPSVPPEQAAMPSLGDDLCVICFELYHQPVAVVPCGHTFCYRCCRLSVVCPLCRGPIKSMKAMSYDPESKRLVPTKKGESGGGDGGSDPSSPKLEEGELKSWFSYNFTKTEFDALVDGFKELDVVGKGRIGKTEVVQLITKVCGAAPTDEEISALFKLLSKDCRSVHLDCELGVTLPVLMNWLSFNRPQVLEDHHRKALRDLRRQRAAAAAAAMEEAEQQQQQQQATAPPPSSAIALDHEVTDAPSVDSLLDQFKLPTM